MEVLAGSDLQSEAYKNSVRADLDKYWRSDLLRVTKQCSTYCLGNVIKYLESTQGKYLTVDAHMGQEEVSVRCLWLGRAGGRLGWARWNIWLKQCLSYDLFLFIFQLLSENIVEMQLSHAKLSFPYLLLISSFFSFVLLIVILLFLFCAWPQEKVCTPDLSPQVPFLSLPSFHSPSMPQLLCAWRNGAAAAEGWSPAKTLCSSPSAKEGKRGFQRVWRKQCLVIAEWEMSVGVGRNNGGGLLNFCHYFLYSDASYCAFYPMLFQCHRLND